VHLFQLGQRQRDANAGQIDRLADTAMKRRRR